MKRNIFYKIIMPILLAGAMLLIFGTVSNAGNANISASSTNVEAGTAVNINVNVNAMAWNLKVSGSGISDKVVGGNMEGTNQATSKSYKLDTSKPGTYTISLTGDVTDANGTPSNISGSTTVTVKEKATPVQTPTTTTTPAQTPKQETPKEADPTFTSTNKTMYTTGSINLRSSWSTSSEAKSVPAGTEVTVTGTSSQKVNGYVWYRVSYDGQTKYVASGLLTSTKPEEKKDDEEETKEANSTNKALKDLVIENYALTPEFNAETTKYSITVEKDIEKLNITATPEDEKATVNIIGNEDLKVGNNIVKVTVTAQDGTIRTYTISVTKTNKESETENLKLKTLQIKNATLSPEFDPSITSYIISVDNPESISKDDITAVAEDEDVQVSITENTQANATERIITIMLEDSEGKQTGVYQITIQKSQSNPLSVIKSNQDNSMYYTLGGIIAALVVLIIIIIILLKKTSNKDDYMDIEDVRNEDETSDNYSINTVSGNQEDDDENVDYDKMLEDSDIKSQILNRKINNNVDGIETNLDSNVELFKKFNANVNEAEAQNQDTEEEYNPDLKTKRKGKHF